MRNRKWIFLGSFLILCSVTACRGERGVVDTTEMIEVEDGIVFETIQEETSVTEQLNMNDLKLTETNIEGMKEERVVLIKYTKIYAKPDKTSSVIGECARGEALNVYGKAEDDAWYIVSFNGRIGYISETCINENDLKNTQTSSNFTDESDNLKEYKIFA